MGVISLLFLVFFGSFIVFFELRRGKLECIIDFLRGISLVFLGYYVIIPSLICIISFESNLRVHPFVRNTNPDNVRFFASIVLAFIAYLFLIGAYKISKNLFYTRLKNISSNYIERITQRQLLFVTILLFILGGSAFLIYLNSLGGLNRFLVLGNKIRSMGAVHFSDYGILVRVAPLIIGASILSFICLYEYRFKRPMRVILYLITGTAIIFSFLLRFHLSGRLAFIKYIATFPLILFLYKKKISALSALTLVGIFGFIIVYGDSLFNYFINYQVTSIAREQKSISFIIGQFSFPIANIYHVVENVPEQASYRYFKDFYIGIANLIPESIFNVNIPERLSVVNTKLLNNVGGAVPVDLVTLGYYNLGVIGVIITSLIYGMITCMLEAVFSYGKSFIKVGLRVMFLLFWIFTVVYCDPAQIVEGGFYLIILSLLFLSLFLLKKIVRAIL